MPINKVVPDVDAAVADIPDGATVLASGFGGAGTPTVLLEALARRGAQGPHRDLQQRRLRSLRARGPARSRRGAPHRVLVSAHAGLGRLRRSVRTGDWWSSSCVPQGTLTKRIHASGAGIGGFYTPTGAGTLLAEGRGVRVLDGREQVFELPLRGDYALVRPGRRPMGNLVYDKVGRNYGPTMAMAAHTTIAEVAEVVAAR